MNVVLKTAIQNVLKAHENEGARALVTKNALEELKIAYVLYNAQTLKERMAVALDDYRRKYKVEADFIFISEQNHEQLSTSQPFYSSASYITYDNILIFAVKGFPEDLITCGKRMNDER